MRDIKIGGIYKHFKGSIYLVEDLVHDARDGKILVLYSAFDGNKEHWVRPLEDFLSEVDHDKYPDVKQKYRFEPISNEKWTE